MLTAYKFRMYPTQQHQELFFEWFGAGRFVWNKALSLCETRLYNSDYTPGIYHILTKLANVVKVCYNATMKTFKYRIYPNKETSLLLNAWFGQTRFVWNCYLVTPEKPKHSPKTGTLKAIKWYNNDQ